VQKEGAWKVLKELDDPYLKELAARLPETVLHSRADSTVRKYLGAFKRWKTWAMKYGMTAIPAKDYQVALYLQHIGDISQSKAAVEEACNALAWVHATAGLLSPTQSPFLRSTLEGMQRVLARPTVRKDPVTSAMLVEIVKDARESNTLSDLRLALACLLAYAGFLRFNELVNIRPCDISHQEDMIVIHLPQSKTDQLRKGDEVAIARTGNLTCPVAMLEAYMARNGLTWKDQRFLFRPISKSGKTEKLRESGNISYSCLRELFKRKLKELGYDHNKFGLHSLRAGGATAAANNGVPDRLFKRHGRWKSEKAKDGYVEDSVKHRLTVSQQIGL